MTRLYIRNKPVTELIILIPRYNVTDFWRAPFHVLLNRIAFYMTEDGSKDVAALLRDIFSTNNQALSQIARFEPSGPYMTIDHANVFTLLKEIQKPETRATMDAFNIDETKLTLLVFQRFDGVNTIFANLVFHSIHQRCRSD